MQRIVFSSDYDTIKLFQERDPLIQKSLSTIEELQDILQKEHRSIILVDYDSVAHDFNKLINTGLVPAYSIVLESVPSIQTGKFLIAHGVKAYANSAILTKHYEQMLQTVQQGDIWTYPELTAALTKAKKLNLSQEAQELIEKRLSPKEKEVLLLVLEGLTNEAIAQKLNISTRTVKAHLSSIFEKLHVNDRLSLALLLLS